MARSDALSGGIELTRGWEICRKEGGARQLTRPWPARLPDDVKKRYMRHCARLAGIHSGAILCSADPLEELAGSKCIVRDEKAYWPEPNRLTRAFSARQLSDILSQIASAVADVHSMGMLMTDLSPRNILLIPDERFARAALADFLTVVPQEGLKAGEKLLLLDPEYASPEARRFAAGNVWEKISTVSDVFSMGMLFHQYLTGMLPGFEAYTPDGIPDGKAKLSRRLSYYYRNLLGKMLEIEPERRMSTAQEVKEEANRIFMTGECYIKLHWTGHEGEIATISGSDGYRSWKRFDEKGEAVFGPVLADVQYSVFHQAQQLTVLRFPEKTGEQQMRVSLDWIQRTEKGNTELPASPLSAGKSDTQAIELSPPLNNIRLIESVQGNRWRLTLINNGSFCINRADAGRYGIAHILDKLSDG